MPADLRVDHVYLISCKYLSKVLHNASPESLFDRRLVGGGTARSRVDWYDAVAPAEHQELYQLVRLSMLCQAFMKCPSINQRVITLFNSHLDTSLVQTREKSS